MAERAHHETALNPERRWISNGAKFQTANTARAPVSPLALAPFGIGALWDWRSPESGALRNLAPFGLQRR